MAAPQLFLAAGYSILEASPHFRGRHTWESLNRCRRYCSQTHVAKGTSNQEKAGIQVWHDLMCGWYSWGGVLCEECYDYKMFVRRLRNKMVIHCDISMWKHSFIEKATMKFVPGATRYVPVRTSSTRMLTRNHFNMKFLCGRPLSDNNVWTWPVVPQL